MEILKILILLLPFSINTQLYKNYHNLQKLKLEIEVSKIKNKGIIYIGIYNNEIDFNSNDTSKERLYNGIIENVQKGNYNKEIFLDKGVYAIKIYIDKNYNNKFDFNIFGLPKEQYGFSNNVMNLFGPPDFDKALFILNDNKKIKINLR